MTLTRWSYTTLLRAAQRRSVSGAVLFPDSSMRVTDADGGLHQVQLLPSQVPGVADRFASMGVDLDVAPPSLLAGLLDVLPMLLVLYLCFGALSAMRQGLGGAGRGTPLPLASADVDTRFDDVAGLHGAKEELFEVVAYLKDPERFARSGARAPKGVLLEGPPGTGKTLLARAVAGETNATFFPVTASSFVELYVGLGAARVRQLFAQARASAPSIVWIDEIDAIAKQRSSGPGSGGNDEREATLNELLSAMDGFGKETGVLVLAATNRADMLDEALLRPGRFDRRVAVGLPDREERVEILEVHARDVTLDDAVSLAEVADETPGFSGAELSNLINEAAIRAMRRNATVVTPADVSEAMDRLLAGLPRRVDARGDATTRRVAVHEAGHAIAGLFSPGYDALARVTIVPRSGGAGGFTLFRPSDGEGLQTKSRLKTHLAVLLAGRAAEELVLGESSTGARDDLRRVHELARRMVAEYGMGSRLTDADEDVQVRDLVEEAEDAALSLLTARRAELCRLTDALLRRDALTAQEVREVIG